MLKGPGLSTSHSQLRDSGRGCDPTPARLEDEGLAVGCSWPPLFPVDAPRPSFPNPGGQRKSACLAVGKWNSSLSCLRAPHSLGRALAPRPRGDTQRHEQNRTRQRVRPCVNVNSQTPASSLLPPSSEQEGTFQLRLQAGVTFHGIFKMLSGGCRSLQPRPGPYLASGGGGQAGQGQRGGSGGPAPPDP